MRKVARIKLRVISHLVRLLPLNARLDDVLWDAQFAASQDMLDQLVDEAHQEYLAGKTEDFDPDNDPDAP